MIEIVLIFGVLIFLILIDIATIVMVFLLLRKIEKILNTLLGRSSESESRITKLEIKNGIL